MSERKLPTEPGWWWVRIHDEHATVVRVETRTWGSEPDGFEVWIGGEIESRYIEHMRFDWLAPVAPLGSVTPEAHARAVRDAWWGGHDYANRVHAAIRNMMSTGVAGHIGAYSFDDGDRCETVAKLRATLTAAGLTAERAEAIVAEVTDV